MLVMMNSHILEYSHVLMIHVFNPLGQWETDHRGVVVGVVVEVVEVVGGELDELTDLTLEESANLTDTVEMTNRQ